MTSRKLTLADIADQRAYERERDEFRPTSSPSSASAASAVGPVITLLFENRDTIRFQVQEMARVEKLISDEAIDGELNVYNPLIPEPGMLCATLFLELTDDMQLREWLPKLVGHRAGGEAGHRRGRRGDRGVVDPRGGPRSPAHPRGGHGVGALRLVPTLRRPGRAVRRRPVAIVIDHEHYQHSVELGPETVAELLSDLRD
jgi:hypothetical protein